jgi:hypothetical protein
MFFESFCSAEITIVSLAVKSFRMHGRALFMLVECFSAAKIAIAQDTRVVYILHDYSILLARIRG